MGCIFTGVQPERNIPGVVIAAVHPVVVGDQVGGQSDITVCKTVSASPVTR